MEVLETTLPGVLLIRPRVFGDDRGFFLESFQAERYAEAGIPGPWIQDNHSRSRTGVLRGLHYQLRFPQGKLVRCARGRVFDVAVDIRLGSPTFGRWTGAILDDVEHQQLWIPPGFAHGFCVLSDVADFEYKCTEHYHPEDDHGVRWDDPEVGIEWPIEGPTLSTKDAKLPLLSGVDPDALPRAN
ncbi:MAG: dTDP-4-dehydrorhamnose 3,5-epimerase [Planctomycetes bacterium]|nr:dTDP-4-dehydrorhamnose 3,5-epimerase [Planctomycetota bacterium]